MPMRSTRASDTSPSRAPCRSTPTTRWKHCSARAPSRARSPRRFRVRPPCSSRLAAAASSAGSPRGTRGRTPRSAAASPAGPTPRFGGAEPVGAPTLTEALKAGKPVDAPAGGVAVDSLAPRRVGELMFPIAQQSIDRVLLVEDDEIVRAQQVLWDVFRIVVEPGGAAALAALLGRRYTPAPDEHVVVVLCGGNTQR